MATRRICACVFLICACVWSAQAANANPEDVVAGLLDAAVQKNEEAFKSHFTPETIEILELAWKGHAENPRPGSWQRMMKETLNKNGSKPTIVKQTRPSGGNAVVWIEIDDGQRVIHLTQESLVSPWRVDLRAQGKIRLPAQKQTPTIDIEEPGIDLAFPEEPWWSEGNLRHRRPYWWEKEKPDEKPTPQEGCTGCVTTPQPPPAMGWLVVGTCLAYFFRKRCCERTP